MGAFKERNIQVSDIETAWCVLKGRLESIWIELEWSSNQKGKEAMRSHMMALRDLMKSLREVLKDHYEYDEHLRKSYRRDPGSSEKRRC